MRRMMVTQVRGASLLAVISYVGLLVLAEPLATLLGGDAYKGMLPLVALLGAGQLICVLAGPSGGVITVARLYRLSAMITVSVALAALVLEALAGFWGHSEVLIALASGAATGGYHVVNNIALSRRLSMTTRLQPDWCPETMSQATRLPVRRATNGLPEATFATARAGAEASDRR